MSMIINTNVASLNATRQLDSSSREQAVSMERLTSGLRINSAADDAAGLKVATSMTSQIKGLDQAARNANDGISLSQTIDGAAEEMNNMMQRQRELMVQGLNDTYQATDIAAMQAEFDALSSELGRVAATTKFNGVSVMDTAAAIAVQVGWETSADDQVDVTTIGGTAIATAVAALNIDTSAHLTTMDTNIAALATQRSAVGAVQNRLEHTVANLQNVSENTSAARSAIQDANFAKESANLARTQVLQQAGMSMLSQANGNSQNVLSLLR